MLVHRCVTPGAVGLVMTTSGMSAVLSAASMAAATAPLTRQCAHGYSGCIGVLSIGCQVASRSVAGLSSISPLRMAVTGRQKSYFGALRASDEPEACVLGLSGIPLGAGLGAEVLYLIVIGGPLLAVQRDRWFRPELRLARQGERLQVRPGR